MNRMFLLLLVMLSSCSSGSSTDPDVTGRPPTDSVADLRVDSSVDAGGLDAPDDSGLVPETADVTAAPYVRARIIEDVADLIGGREQLGEVGDYLLENKHVRFIIRNKERGLYNPYTVSLIDADLVRGEDEEDNDRLFEIFPLVGLIRTLNPTSSEILEDGAGSNQAVVRFSGTDGGIPLIDSILMTKKLGLEISIDFVLTPEAHHLEIVTTVTNPGDKTIMVPIGDLALFGDSLRAFCHQCGLDTECTLGRSDVDWYAAAGHGVAYGISVPNQYNPTVPLTREEILPIIYDQPEVAPGETVSVSRWLIVGEGTIDSISSRAWTMRKAKLGTIDAIVNLADEFSAMEDVFIQAFQHGEGEELIPFTATSPDQDGAALLRLPKGTYDLRMTLPGSEEVVLESISVQPEEVTPVVLDAQPAGRLQVNCADEKGAPLICKLSLQPGHGAAWGGGVQQRILVRGGDFAAPVLPGDYTATATKGFEYSVFSQDVTVKAGEEASVKAVLTRVVDTTGWMSVDTHDHSELSIDSNLLQEDRILAAAAEGLEVFSMTDHDHFGTLQPRIEAMGLEDRVKSLLGNEVSPLYGHQVGIGCDPMEYDSYFTMNWTLYEDEEFVRLKTPSEIWGELHTEHGCAFVAVAHPYSSQPLFEFYHLDETMDPAELDPAELDINLLDAIELINGDEEWGELIVRNLPAWFSFLNRGYILPAVGGADSHAISQTTGHPRNLVISEADAVGEVNGADLLETMKQYGSQIYGGPFIRFTVQEQPLGSVVTVTEGPVVLHVRVDAPDWMAVDYVRVFANGELIHDEVPAGQGVVRYEVDIEHEPEGDCWYVVAAGSETSAMGPVAPGRYPLSLTNPIFIDTDGDGFTPASQ